MKELNEIEAMFVDEMLEEHGEYVVDLMQDSIKMKDIRLTDDLLNSISFKKERRGNDYVLSISFLTYGRVVEIRSNKSRKMRREPEAGNKKAKSLRKPKKIDTKFYAKNVYGSLNHLLRRMSSGYSDIEIERLKGIIQSRNP